VKHGLRASPLDFETIGREIVDSAIRVRTRLGPGTLESAYEACMEYETGKRSLAVKKQIPMPLRYDDLTIDIGYRLDLIVEEAVVIELKSVKQLLPIYTAIVELPPRGRLYVVVAT
jgi:GxxExxY protein